MSETWYLLCRTEWVCSVRDLIESIGSAQVFDCQGEVARQIDTLLMDRASLAEDGVVVIEVRGGSVLSLLRVVCRQTQRELLWASVIDLWLSAEARRLLPVIVERVLDCTGRGRCPSAPGAAQVVVDLDALGQVDDPTPAPTTNDRGPLVDLDALDGSADATIQTDDRVSDR